MKKRANITNIELEEIVFILLNCLDEEKKKNREIINTLKIYLLYHKGQILNYVFSFLQIQKVSHENQKLLLSLVHDFVHYCIYNRFSNTVDEYLDEVKRNETEKEKRGATQKWRTHKFKDLHIFENILKYSFFDGDEYCFVFQHLPEGGFLPDAVSLQEDVPDLVLLQQADSGAAFSPQAGNLNFPIDGNPMERIIRGQKKKKGSIFHEDKIAKLICLKKEEYKAAMVGETKTTQKSNQCASLQRNASHWSGRSHAQNAKETSEINNIIRNIIDFLLNEILFIKREDDRHGIMTKLLILCVVREDAYLKKRFVEKLNGCLRMSGTVMHLRDAHEGDGKRTNDKLCEGQACNDKVKNEKQGDDFPERSNTKLCAYLELYIDLFRQVPHLTKNVLNELFNAILSLGQSSRHTDLTYKIMVEIFQDIQFPSVLYTIISMNKKYKRKAFIIPNEHYTNVYIENDIIHLSLENTSEDTCTTYTRESSLNSNVQGKSNDLGILTDNIRRINLHRVRDGGREDKFTSYMDHSSEHTSKNASMCDVFYDAHNGEMGRDVWDIPREGEGSQEKGSDSKAESSNGASRGKQDLVKAFQREIKPSDDATETFRNESEGSEKYYTVKNWREEMVCQVAEGSGGSPPKGGADVLRDKESPPSFSLSPCTSQDIGQKERKRTEKIRAVCTKMLALYLSILPSFKQSSENYNKLLYIISKLVLYINNDEMTKEVIEVYIHYFLVFFHSTINNAALSDISGVYNKDLQVHINYNNVRGLPQYNIINSFRSILQKCLTKIHLIVGFANHILKVAYAILIIMINQNYTMNNAKGVVNYITSNVYVSTFIETMELFNILITCAYTNNLVFNLIREKAKSNIKVEVMVSLTLLRQYLLLISGDIGSGNIVHLSNQNIGTKRGTYKNCFKRLNSFISDTSRTKTSNVELIIQMVANLSDRFSNDLSIIYMLLEIDLILSYHHHFDSSSFNPSVILGLLPRVSSPLCDLYMVSEDIRGRRKEGKSEKSRNSGTGGEPPNGETFPPQENQTDEHINTMGHHDEEIKTWLLIPNRHVIKIMHFLINILLSEESKFKKQNKKYGYSVDDNGTIIDINCKSNEVLKNGFHHNRMFFDIHWNFFIFMYPSVPYIKELISLAFQKHFCFYSPRVLYPLMFELLVDVKRSFRIIVPILKALNIMCILLHNHMVKKHLRLHSRLHYNYLVLPNISNVISVLFMYCTHSNFVVSFLSLQLISILRSFTQGKSITSVQSFTYFELLFSFLRLRNQVVTHKGVDAPFTGDILCSRKILKRIIALTKGRMKRPIRQVADSTRVQYYRSLIKMSYREIGKRISKKVLNISLSSNCGGRRKTWRRKVRAIVRHYFNVDLGALMASQDGSGMNGMDANLTSANVSAPFSLDMGGLMGTSAYANAEANTLHATLEPMSFCFTRILRLMQRLFSTYVKVEIDRIYNYHSYITTFFYSLVELARLVKNSQEFENTLMYLNVVNLLCVIIKQFSEKYANKMITIFFKLNGEVPVNEEENMFLTLYMNFSTIYRSHFFNLYRQKCTTPYMKNCIECIQLMRVDCLSSKRSTENQLDLNNFMLLSNKYSTDMSREKNIGRFLHYLSEYQSVYRARLFQLGVCSEGGNYRRKEEKGHVDVKRNPSAGEGSHDLVQNNAVQSTTQPVNHKDNLKKRLYQSNEVVRKSYQLLEDKLGSYILQNDISFSISKQFHQDVISYYIESILKKNNLFRVLFLLNNIYHSDVANRKSSAFSIFGKSSNVINSENIRSTLILTMGKCLRKVPSAKVRDLSIMRDVYMNEKIFVIYIKHVYVPLVRYSIALSNAIYGKDDSVLNEEHIVREVLSNRKRYVDERYGEEINMNALVRRSILSGFEKKESVSSSPNGLSPKMDGNVVTLGGTPTAIANNNGNAISSSINGENRARDLANMWKRLPNEKINLLIFQLLVDPIICSLYEEKETTLQANLLRAVKMVSKKLKYIKEPGGEVSHMQRMKWDQTDNQAGEIFTNPPEYTVTNNLDIPNHRCSIQDVCDYYLKENLNDVPFYSCLYIYKYIIIHWALYYLDNFDEQTPPISNITFTGVEKFALYFKEEKSIITNKSENQIREDIKTNGSNGEPKENNFLQMHLEKEQRIMDGIQKWGEMIDWECKEIHTPSDKVIYNDYFSDLMKERGTKNESRQDETTPLYLTSIEPHLDIQTETYTNLKNALESIHNCFFLQKPMQYQPAFIIIDVLTRLLLKIVLNEKKQIYRKCHEGRSPHVRAGVLEKNADELVMKEDVTVKNSPVKLEACHMGTDHPRENSTNRNLNITKGKRKRNITNGKLAKEKKHQEDMHHRTTGGRTKWDTDEKSHSGADENVDCKKIVADELFTQLTKEKKKKKNGKKRKKTQKGHNEGNTNVPIRGSLWNNKMLHANNKTLCNLRMYEDIALSCLNLITSIIVKTALHMDCFHLQFKIIKYLHDMCVATDIAEVKFLSFRILSQIVINVGRVGRNNVHSRIVPQDGGPLAEDTQTGQLNMCKPNEKKQHYTNAIKGDKLEGKENRGDNDGKNVSSGNSANIKKYYNLIFSSSGNTSYGNPFDANERGGTLNLNEGNNHNGRDSEKCGNRGISAGLGKTDGQSDSNEQYLDSVSNEESNTIEKTTNERVGGNHLHREETSVCVERGEAVQLNDHTGSDKGSDSSIMCNSLDGASPPYVDPSKGKTRGKSTAGGAVDHEPNTDEGGSIQEENSGSGKEAKSERNYICECIGLLIPYVKDPEKIISYLSVCSVCALLAKLQRGKMLSNSHFVYFFFNRIEVILDVLSSQMTNPAMGKKTKRKVKRERASWKGQSDRDKNNSWERQYGGEISKTLEEAPPNEPISCAANYDENPTEETFIDEGERINEKTCGSIGGGSGREDGVEKMTYQGEKSKKEDLNGFHARGSYHLRLGTPRVSYKNIRRNMCTVELHNNFHAKVRRRIREINSGTYQTSFIKKVGQVMKKTRKEINLYKVICDVISEVLCCEEKKSYVKCLISCIHNKNRQVAISGLNLLMYHTWNERISHQDIDIIMNRVLNEVHYYTKVNVLNGRWQSLPSGSFSKTATPGGTDAPNSTLDAYRNMCKADEKIRDQNKNGHNTQTKKRSNDKLDKRRNDGNILERALRIILLLCREHPYVVMNKLCTLKSKYSYEHVYFIYMICNNETLLHKTMDYLFYLMNSLDRLKLTKNLSNILSLVFHFLKFRNGYIRNYTRKYFIELFIIMFYVLGVKQLGHMSGVVAISASATHASAIHANGKPDRGDKTFSPSWSFDTQNLSEGELQRRDHLTNVGQTDKADEATAVGATYLTEDVYGTDQSGDARAKVPGEFEERRKVTGRRDSKGAATQRRNAREGNSQDDARPRKDSDDTFENMINGSPFFVRRKSILRSRDVKKVSKREFNKKIYQNYTCSISVNNTLNCLRIIKELLKLNRRKRILKCIEEGKVEKLLYYKHSFENGLIQLIHIFLSNLRGSGDRNASNERGYYRKVFNFLDIFLKSKNLNYVIISLVTLSQFLLCMSIEGENLKLVEPIINVLYHVNCTHKNEVITKYLHLCFTNLFIIFKAIRKYQFEMGSEPIPLLIKEEYSINILNSLFVNLDNSNRNIVKVTLKAFKEACKYARSEWPSPLCASYVNILTTPSVVLPYLNSSEAAEKILMCGILREIFRTLRWERLHKGGSVSPIQGENTHRKELSWSTTQTSNLPKKHIYEIATYLMIHLVDKRKNVSSSVWSALKELLRWKFSHHVNDMLLYFDRKLFLPSECEVDGVSRINVQREYFKRKGSVEGEKETGAGADYDYFAKGCTWDEKSSSKGEVSVGMLSSVPTDRPTGGHIHDVEKSHSQEVAPHSRNTTGEQPNEGKKNRRPSTMSVAKKSDEESDMSEACSFSKTKKEKVNAYYYKLLVEICIPLIICTDTKVALKRNLLTELNSYLYGADFDSKDEDNKSLINIKKENDRLQQIFSTNLKMNLNNINSVYRAYIILLSSRIYLGTNIWNANIPINEDIEKMISEYEVKSTKSRAEHVLFGDLKNYMHTRKRREKIERCEKKKDKLKKKKKKDGNTEDAMQKSITSVLTDSILNTLSGTFNYSYDGAFFNSLNVSGSVEAEYNHRGKGSINGGAKIDPHKSSQVDWIHQAIHTIKTGDSDLPNDNSSSDEEDVNMRMGEEQKEGPSHQARVINTNNQSIEEDTKDHSLIGPNGEPTCDDRQGEELNLEVPLEDGNNTPLQREFPSLEYKRSRSFDPAEGFSNENYANFISSSDEGEGTSTEKTVGEDEQCSNALVKGVVPTSELLFYTPGDRNAKEFLRRKLAKIQLLNQKHNFVDNFKTVLNLKLETSLLQWIEMLKFLKEDPPEFVLSKESKIGHLPDFFESALICALSVIKLVSLSLDCKKLHRVTFKSMKREAQTTGDTQNLNVKVGRRIDGGGEEDEPCPYLQDHMEETYFIQLLSICTKLEALCSSISKQLCAFLQEERTPEHLPIIRALAMLSILKPSP
ncbi:conserved Plasmodium protein, unknown function [Plasmodium knowlesi strain H]|uniref:Uncharacterized protein n=3 Tax=Plasmodium knowlesi TaxID=5850 RepID=A0A5K1VCI5_PLAKH|nr:conserved Plasmodium protein, unknown function [Plasmodium knowlesi strain H]OTN65901.1 Uncharacterized protein PKNOH_S100051400 [Plasmodium knowlesi]CAA9987872.1 conserved Plasmodium protein, unknown function [Plasmodium knowlesi strain H]SBO22288.1 conserved Plasmodium protein, unknown function [Plasmodium knowlesi strain H]SBO28805.1 conserved Plasmodium protein, unknown function [Plasmodium knowlesi strain H]VVS77346.1 conserved Plasmodium protein, unknown function [Plasmodium knowlesi |eukprot:XP_002258871.1 hypothetical protein, conserved in Plasmodium species [Plasmodium knowlesi strain H]